MSGVLFLTLGAWGRSSIAADCGDWNTKEFFKTATPRTVGDCLASGADIRARDENGWTPLHFAAMLNKNPAMVAKLIGSGADVEARDKNGMTPLHLAAGFNKDPAVVAKLIGGRADIKARTKNGKTPWDSAQGNAALKGTDVWWRLNEGRF